MNGVHCTLSPYPSEAMAAYAVSAFVNDARHEGPECARPLATA
jgi:hypothetical protein